MVIGQIVTNHQLRITDCYRGRKPEQEAKVPDVVLKTRMFSIRENFYLRGTGKLLVCQSQYHEFHLCLRTTPCFLAKARKGVQTSEFFL